jgi:peptide/nickel transport system substrate-binding protein
VLVALSAMAAQCGAPAVTQPPPTVAQLSPTPASNTSTPAAAATATLGAATQATSATVTPTAAAQPTAAASAAPPPQPDVLRVGIPFLRLLNPIRAYSFSQVVLSNVCERLLDHNAPGASSLYTYKLATALTHSDDGLTWTAALRPGVKFHDGTPLTAEVVKGSVAAAEDHADSPASFAAIASIDTPDEQTVIFHLNTPLDLALVLASGPQIISAKGLAADKTNTPAFDKGLDACSGPYTIKAVTADKIDLALNADYWNPVALPGRPSAVEVHIVPAADELQQLLNGQLDLALGATAMFKGNPAFTLYSTPSFNCYSLFLNTQRLPLDDKRVRQAIVYAIDTGAIIAKLSQVSGVPVYPLHGPLPDGMYPASPDVQPGPFDRAKAQQLLADAGHPGGGFSLRLVYYDQDSSATVYVPLLQQDLAQIGVTLQAQPLAIADLLKTIRSANPATGQDIVGNGRSPFHLDGAVDILLPYHSSATKSYDLSYYNNPAYDKLVDSAFAQEITNPDAAMAQFVQAQKLLVDDAPVVFLFAASANYVLPNYLKGFAYNPNYSDGVDFYSMYYNPVK